MRNNDPFKEKWDIVIMALAIYNCFLIPYDIAFEPDVFKTPLIKAFNIIIDAVFLLDIVINSRTIYINAKTGEEVNIPKKICMEYIKTLRFWIDLLASIPLDDMLGVIMITNFNRIS